MNLVGTMSQADRIRLCGQEKYVKPARDRKERRFSIRAGDVLKDLNLPASLAAAACSALKSREFKQTNAVNLISWTGPPSGQSTTVTYTYEFVDGENSGGSRPSSGSVGTPQSRQAAWEKLRGALKDVFAEYGGGEAYLRAERASFRDADADERK